MRKNLAISILLVCLYSCENMIMETVTGNSPENNFELLWTTLDRKYAYFATKKIDWDSIYRIYRPMITEDMSDHELYLTLSELLMELKDAHTDLHGPFEKITYNYYGSAPDNFDGPVLQIYYLKDDFRKINSVYYKIIGNTGYMHVRSFSEEISTRTMNEIMEAFADVNGIIIDVRNNTGGNGEYSNRLTRTFFDERRFVEYLHVKTGAGHDDFAAVEVYFDHGGDYQFLKPVAVLTNRKVYSAANTFVSRMSVLPHVRIIGDTTGGGGGIPYYYELPNGWYFRYSATRSVRMDGRDMDRGIPPDHLVYMKNQGREKFMDPLIESALAWINNPSANRESTKPSE